MTLTDRQIRSAQVPAGLNQVELRDDQVRGLLLRVYSSGTRTWMLHYRRQEDDRRRFLKLGAYPGVSLKQARQLAEVEVGRIAAGDDPQGERVERRTASTAETVAELAEQYLTGYSKAHKRPKSYAMDRWQLDAYVLPRWGDRPVDEITKRDVRELLDDLAEGKLAARGKPTTVAPRNLKALLSKLFDWAADRGILAGNPAAGVKLPDRVREHLKKGGKDRVLSDEEIGVLWGELEELEDDAHRRKLAPVSAAAFRLILLTAQRPGEVFAMRWRDIEDGAWWVVPAEVAKNGEANRVYLSPQARAILDALRGHTGGSEWVLESPRKPGTHLTTVRTARLSILDRGGMRPWTPHDLRRTAASKMRAHGVSRLVVQGILNHKDRSVTAVYDRYGADPEKQKALTEWGRRVEEIAGGGAGARVVEFRARGGGGR
jgi:integrase